jgi:hypothetical protein
VNLVPPRQVESQQLEYPIDAQIESEYRREIRKLDDLAFTFLNAAGGDTADAERLLDDAIALLFEDGTLSTWRYRIILAAIREGL